MLKWLWACNLPVVWFMASGQITEAQAFAYLGFVSIYANWANHWGGEEAAQARLEAVRAAEEMHDVDAG